MPKAVMSALFGPGFGVMPEPIRIPIDPPWNQ